MSNNSFSLLLHHREDSKSFISEELEAEEDEIRRNEEIKEIMQNAFEDLEDSRSISSGSYLASLSGFCNSKNSYSEFSSLNQKQNNDENETQNQYLECSDKNQEINYISTINRLQEEIQHIKQENYEQKNELLNRLNSVEKTRDEVLNQFNKIRKSFDESQSMLLEKENELKNCLVKLQVAEKMKNEALQEIKISQINIEELQQLLSQQEKKNFQREGEINHLIEKLSAIEKQKVSDYYKEYDNLNDRLISKEKKCNELEQKLLELQQLHRSVVAEKSETITKLISNLESCQSQCQKLMSTNLNRSSDSEIDKRDVIVSGNSKLIEELSRTYANLKQKNDEIKSLQERVKMCNTEMKKNREFETQYFNNLSTLKRENANLEQQLENLSKLPKQEANLYEDIILQMEKRLKNLEIENKVLKSEKYPGTETRIDFSENENSVGLNPSRNQSLSKVDELNKKLENNLKESDTLKQMYLDISSSKEKLIFQNKQFQADINKLKNDNAILNEIVKSIHTGKNEILQSDSLGQDSVYFTYCPRSHPNSKTASLLCSSTEIHENLKAQLQACELKFMQSSDKYNQDMECLVFGMQDYIFNIESNHTEQLSELKKQYSKQIEELELKHSQEFNRFEVQFKEIVLKISSEEIQNLSNRFQKYLDTLSKISDQLRSDLETKNRLIEKLKKQLEDANIELKNGDKKLENAVVEYNQSANEWKEKIKTLTTKQKKLLTELNIIYGKYKTARKTAVDSKQMLNERLQLLHQQQHFFIQTLNDIQNYLYEKLDCKIKDDGSVSKIDHHDVLIIPSEEIDAALRVIEKQLKNLSYKI